MECPRCGWWNAEGVTTCAACLTPFATAAPAAAPTTPPPSIAPEPAVEIEPTAAAAGALAAAPLLPGFTPMFAATAVDGPTAAVTPRDIDETIESGVLRPWNPVPGPTDRESFFDAMARHRRATWRQNAVCALAAFIVGIPISLVLTPIVFIALMVLTWVLDLVAPVPMPLWDAYHAILQVPYETFDHYLDDLPETQVHADQVVLTFVIWIIPGILAMLALWPALRGLFRNAGTEGMLRAIGAREPRLTDLEERQLINVVEEMAIAAGLPPPRVMLLDTSVRNGAVVGSGPSDAVIVVGRGLLDELNRDDTQGVLAHLIAAIGNGDLRVAGSIIAMYQTFGFAAALMKTPISGEARRMVWRVLRFSFERHDAAHRERESVAVSRLLMQESVDFADEQDDLARSLERSEQKVQPRPRAPLQLLYFVPVSLLAIFVVSTLQEWPREQTRLAQLAVLGAGAYLIWYQRAYVRDLIGRGIALAHGMALLPYYLTVLFPQLLLSLLVSFMLEPVLAMAWRTRRYLADATAVQLTRNPDWIAGGLLGLTRRGAVIPSGKWAAPLFIVGGPVVAQQSEQEPTGGKDRVNVFGGSGVVNFFPPLQKRLEKLRRLGATVVAPSQGRRRGPTFSSAAGAGLITVGTLLVLALIVMWIVLLVLVTALSIGFTMFLMAFVYGILLLFMPG